jgi:hypothetical protein
MANKIHDVLKVADIHQDELSDELYKFIKADCTPDYTDRWLREHLYNIGFILENPDEWYSNPTEGVLNELRDLHKEMSKRGCAYLRITNS